MTYLLGRNDPTPRLRPSTGSGLVAALATGAIVLSVQLTSGIPYRAWGTSDRALVVAEMMPMAVAAVFLVAFAVWSQWDSIWRDPFRLPVAGWVRGVMILASAGVVLRLLGVEEGDGGLGWRTLALLAVIAALTGFVEELALRGVLLRGLRVGRRPELVGALWVTLASALIQLPVLAIGNRGLVPLDVGVAFCLGALFYLVRRTTGRLWPAVVLHALWDFSWIADRAAGDLTLSGVDAAASVVLAAGVVVALVVTLRGDGARRALVDPRLA